MARRKLAVILSVLAVVLGIGFAAQPASAAGVVNASFKIEVSWGTQLVPTAHPGGYQATYTIHNQTPFTLQDWAVEFDLPTVQNGRPFGTTTITAHWDSQMTRDGDHITFRALDWNRRIPKFSSYSFGFIAERWFWTPAQPVNCQVNSRACNAGPPG